MCAAKAPPSDPAAIEEKFQKYFTLLAPKYGHLTGNATRKLLTEALAIYGTPMSIDSSSIVHDNAAGPGTATEALIDWCIARGMTHTPKIIATDNVPAMVDALETSRSQNPKWTKVTAQLMNSQHLSLATDTFTHVFCNFSVFNFSQPLLALQEIHRTLKPKGIAMVTCWKRFGVDEIMGTAQKIVKGDAFTGPVKPAGPDFAQEGYLAGLMDVAGWERGKIKTTETSVVLHDTDVEGLLEFLDGDYMSHFRAAWSDDEKAKWPEAVRDAVKQYSEKYGGVKLEAWVVLARKWDELSG